MNRDLIQQAFPNQPRMQAAFESLVADAEAATERVQTALAAISGLSDGAEDIVAELAAKQPKNATLDAISDIGTDPGVLEQVQPGIVSIRAIDTDDTEALMSRRVADTRYLGATHSALTADKLTTARTIAMTADGSWSVSFDGSGNVTSALTLATVNATTGTFGSATQSLTVTVNTKGLVTNISAQTITPAFSSITGKPTTLSGYGITDAQPLNALLTAYAGAAWSAGVQIPTLTAANTVALKTVGSATGNILDKAAGDTLYLAIGGTAAAATKLATGRTIGITGDLVWTSPAFDGTGNVTAAGTLATVNSNVGSFGSATQVATFTVNGKGLTTAAANVTITPAVGSITGLGTGVATALAVNVGSAGAFVTFNGAGGTPSSLTLTNATGLVLTSGVTGILPGANGGTGNGFFAVSGPATSLKTFTLPNASATILTDNAAVTVAQGGTGVTSYAVGDILYASASGTLSKLADVATGNVLNSGGVTTAPSWGKVGLTTHISGTLGAGNGGTGVTSLGNITKTDDTNVTLTLGGTPTGAVITSTSFTLGWSGTLSVARGGTGDSGTAWTAYTPTVTAGSGTFTTVSATGRYKQIGKTTFVEINITITTNGTAATGVFATLPVNAAAAQFFFAGREYQSVGKMLQGNIDGAGDPSHLYIVNYDNTYPGANGNKFVMGGVYEAA